MTNNNVYGDYSMVQPKNFNPTGRFPANLIHDGSDVVKVMFPDTQSGKAEVGAGKGYAENASGIASNGLIASCY